MSNTQIRALLHAVYYLARVIILSNAKCTAQANDTAEEIKRLTHELE